MPAFALVYTIGNSIWCVVGAEVHEQLVDVVEDLGRAGVGPVDLVERHDDRQPAGHRLLEHVAGLRQRALGGVDEQQDASTIRSARSTSPPKSAWPGVSTMFRRTSP